MSGGGSIGSGGESSSSGTTGEVTAFGELSVAQPSAAVLIHFPYNLNTDIISTDVTGSGSVTHSGQLALIASGAASSSSGMLLSNRVLEYNPGIGGLVRYTAIFGTGTAGNDQISGVGNDTDGFFFGYNGTSFGILHRQSSVDTWLPQASWNTDPMDGTGLSGMTLDTTKGNVFQIRYQWLGFGAIRFYIENESNGTLQQVHRIDYANQNTVVSVDNPSFPFCAQSINSSNTTDIQMKVSSVGMFIEGNPGNVSYTRNAVENGKAVTNELNVLTIRNKATYQSVVNAVQVQPDFIALATDGAKSVIFRLYRNATLGGSPSYADVRTNNSVVDWDTVGTTVSNGVLLAAIPVAKVANAQINLAELNIILSPGDTLTITAESSSSNDAEASVSWLERFT